jgi:Protein-disulfide isomerase
VSTPRRRATSRARQVKTKRSPLTWLIIAAVVVIVSIIGAAMLGHQATEIARDDTIIVSQAAPPANAEPNGRAWGPKDAPISVIEYMDYECPSCAYFALNYEHAFFEKYAATGKVRFEVQNAPFHGEGAQNAAQAAYCAAEQNSFWQMHDTLFLNQPSHDAPDSKRFTKERLLDIASKLDLDQAAFRECLTSGKYSRQVQTDLALAQLAVTGTPTFYINKQMYTGPLSIADFAKIFAEVAPEVGFE